MLTYKKFWHELNEEFKFTIDVAADDHNHMLPRFYTSKENGLKQDWGNEVVWCNPPYGKDTFEWALKACLELERHWKEKLPVIVMLLPNMSHEWICDDHMLKGRIMKRFVGRLEFTGPYGYPDDLQLLIFRNVK